jgi:predicted outer membrane protein
LSALLIKEKSMSTLRKRTAVMAAGLSCLLVGLVVAQQVQVVPGQSERDRTAPPRIGERQDNTQLQPGTAQQFRTGDTQRTAGGVGQDVDRFLSNCWLNQNQAEVQISKIAQQKAENPQVRQFAQMMIDDHGQLTPKLQQLAMAQAVELGRQPSATTSAPGAPGQPVATDTQNSVNPAGAPNSAPSATSTLRTGVAGGQFTSPAAGGNQAVNQLIAIDKQIGERCSELMRQELDQKSGAEFDKCYIGGEIGSHLRASAALEVISQQATGELKQLASQAKQTVDQHLREAKEIAQQLEGRAGNRLESRQTGATLDRNVRPTAGER